MKRTQLYLEESILRGLQAMAKTEKTTISELVRQAVQAQYFSPRAGRAQAMQAFIGIRANDPDQTDSTTLVRQMRRGNRLSRLNS
jgi:hypothetical protein